MTTTSPRIEISRPGTFRSTDGREWYFGTADLAAAAAAYDADAEPAPLVIGHPALDAPAYGWVERLEMVGDKLVATPKQIEPAFAEAVRAGRYKRVSASWYPPDHRQNPTPGIWALKHIGFLGGAAPAVRGLDPVHFSEAQIEGAVTIDNPEELHVDPEDTQAADTGADAGTDAGSDQADFAEQQAALDTRTAEQDARAGELDTREQSVADREAAADRRDQAAADAVQAATREANVAFAEGLISGGRLAPAGKAKIVGLLDVLQSTATASFGEEGELSPADVLKDLLGTAGPIVDFSERAGAGDPGPKSLDPVELAQEAVQFAEAERQAGRTITVQAAVRHVERQRAGA